MLRFVLIFFVLLIGLMWLVVHSNVQQAFVMPWTALLAKISGSIVLFFDSNVVSYGNTLQNAKTGIGVAILPGCNAVEASIILISGVLAFPAPWRARLGGVVFGVMAVQLFNILRIISLFFLALWSDSWFYIAHTYLWQILIMLDVLIFWLVWIRHVGRHSTTALNPVEQPLA